MKKVFSFALALIQVMILFFGTLPVYAQAAVTVETAESAGSDNKTETVVELDSAALQSAVNASGTVVASGTCGENLTWALYDDGELVISGTGAMSDYRGSGDMPWSSHRGSIKTVTIENGVTTIDGFAFYECTNLNRVSIGSSVTTIGEYTFAYCERLKSIAIPDNVTTIDRLAFSDCSSLESIAIPASVTTIGELAFLCCSSLTGIWVDENNPNYSSDARGVLFNKDKTELIQAPATISGSYTIPSGVTTIGDSAFYNCDGLTSITIPTSVTTILYNAFQNCSSLESVTIPDSVTFIEYDAFSGCSSLESAIIGDGVIGLGNSAFEGCTNLKRVTIGNSVTRIADSAFNFCSSLERVTIPDSVTIIGGYAFKFCYSLQEIKFLGDAPGIREDAFVEVTATAYYPAGNETWTEEVQQNYGGTITWVAAEPDTRDVIASGTCGENLTWTLYDDGELVISGIGAMSDWSYATKAPWYSNRSSIKKVTIEDGVTTIGDCAFHSCSGLESVTIPSIVTTIGEWAFYSCSSLERITIPDGVTIIGDSAFDGCSSLESVTIPDGVTIIGSYAFSSCSSLQSVTIGNCVTTIGNRAFYSCSSLQSVTIPLSVTRIGDYAFCGCSNLQSITIPSSVTTIGQEAFRDCSSLTGIWVDVNNPNYTSDASGVLFNKVKTKLIQAPGGISGNYTVPDSVTTIVRFAFAYSSLERVTIPESVTTIGDNVFAFCGSLTGIWVDVNNPNYSSDASGVLFNKDKTELIQAPGEILGSYTIPDGVITLVEWAFYNCHNLQGITIPDSVTAIGDRAFYSCDSLTSVTIPDSVTSLNGYVFAYCRRLTEINFRGSAPKLDNYVFYCVTAKAYYPAENETWTEEVRQNYGGTITWVAVEPDTRDVTDSGTCGENLTWTLYDDGELVISGTGDMSWVTMPPWYSYDTSVKVVNIQNGVTNIGNYAFSGCTNLESITIPASVTSIGAFAFEECTSLQSIAIPDSVTSILEFAFDACSGLEQVTIGKGISFLSPAIFRGCTALQSITIPGNVQRIGANAFNQCTSLQRVTIQDGVSTIGLEAFCGCTSLESITIPASVRSIEVFVFSQCISLREMRFMGSAPSMYTASFVGVTATAYYPANDATWTEEVRQNYGGTITWVAKECESIASGTCGENLTWTLDEVGTLTISGTGVMEDFDSSNGAPWYDYADSIKVVKIEDGITAVGNSAFSGCTVLTRIHFIGSAPAFGADAFEDVTATVYYPANDATWTGEVRQSYGGAIAWVAAGTIAAGGVCGEYVSWILDDQGTLTISGFGEMLNYAGECVESYLAPWYFVRESVKKVEIKDGVTAIGNFSFYCCNNLESITIPDSVTTIGAFAFERCSSLQNITIPAGVTTIGDYTFCGCNNLNTIRFNGSAPVFDYSYGDGNIFGGVTATAYYPADDATWTEEKRQNYGGTITWIPRYTDESGAEYAEEGGGVKIVGYGGEDNELEIPEEIDGKPVTAIAEFAFSGLENLTAVVIPDSITEIGEYAFYNCPDLERVTIYGTAAEGVQSVGKNNNAATTIGDYAFAGCTKLTEFYFLGDAPMISASAFVDVTATAYYPANNATWTEAARQNYGGTITWVETPVLPGFGGFLTLNETIDLCVVLPAELVPTTCVFKVTKVATGEPANFTLEQNTQGQWILRISFLSNRMYEEVTICAFDTDGNQLTKATTTSVSKFASAMISANISTTLNAMLIRMLDYGALAQIYSNVATDNLANSIITAAQRDFINRYTLADGEAYSPVMGSTNGVFEANLTLNESVDMNIYTDVSNIDPNEKLVVTLDGEELSQSAYRMTVEEGKIRIRYSFHADKLNRELGLAIVDSTTGVARVQIALSIRKYAHLILNAYSTIDPTLCAMMVALLDYGALAQQYAGTATGDLANRYVSAQQRATLTNYPWPEN